MCHGCNKEGHTLIFCDQVLEKLKSNEGKDGVEIVVWTEAALNRAKNIQSTYTVNNLNGNSNKVALPTVVGQVYQKGGMVEINIFLDQGSQKTLVSKELIKKLKLQSCEKIQLAIQGINSKTKPEMYEVYEMFVKTNEGDVKIKAVGLDKLPSIQMPGYNKVMKNLKQNNSNLAKQQIGNEGQIDINVLIGSDFYNDIIKNEKSTLVEKMRLMPSKLGLIPFGPYQISDNEGTSSNN